MSFEKVTDHIFADTSGANGGNMGAVILDDQIVIIDSGMFHHKTREIERELVQEYDLPVKNLIITHYHSDHVFGAQAFESASIISSESTREICESNLDKQWNIEELRNQADSMREERPEFHVAVQDLQIHLPDVVFKRHLSVGPNMELSIEHVGGHTSGSSIVSMRSERIAFVGDLIFNGSFPYAGDPTSDPERWIMALEKILAGRYELLIPGHGPICGNEQVTFHIDFLESFRSRVIQARNDGMTPDQFIEEGLVPKMDLDKADRRVESAVKHFFKYYG